MTAHDANRSRLAWRCRRGIKELDLLLENWLLKHFETATDEQRARFASLLELPDPQLAGYLLGALRPGPAEAALAAAIAAVRGGAEPSAGPRL